MKKIYTKPTFELVRADESNKVFFAGSGGPVASLPSMSKVTGSW